MSIPIFEKPVFIICLPRSGSTLLFSALNQSADLWSLGQESHRVFNAVATLRVANRGYKSMVLSAADSSKEISALLRAGFSQGLKNRDGLFYSELNPALRPAKVRLIEKTPRTCLAVSFLKASFPDAQFILLHRKPEENIASLMEGWASDLSRYVTIPNLPGWDRKDWKFFLPDGWQKLNGKSIAEIAAFQWREGNATALKDLEALPDDCWTTVSYTDLVAEPQKQLQRLCDFMGVDFDPARLKLQDGKLPLSRSTVTLPSAEKWRKYEKEILGVLDSLKEVTDRLRQLSQE